MSNTELSKAIETANDALPLPYLAAKRDITLDGKGYAECPFCKGSNKFRVKKSGSGAYYFNCISTSCSAHADNNQLGKDAIGLIAMLENIQRKEAVDIFLELAQVPKPKYTPKKKSAAKKQSSKNDESTVDDEQATDSESTNDSSGIEDNEDEEDNIIHLQQAEESKPQSKDPSTYFTRLEPESRNPWEEIYRRLTLDDHHLNELMAKRGLSPETIRRAGIKTSKAANKNLLAGIDELFKKEDLLRDGIIQDRGHGTYLSPQLTGLGNTGKKDNGGNFVFEPDVNPAIIPYSKNGECFYLRPHKGGISGKKWREKNTTSEFEDDEDDLFCSSHVYCPALLEQLLDDKTKRTVVLTEGEYKALALFQCGIPAIAVPGITFLKNPAFRKELVEIIHRFNISDLVVIYDNEDKSDTKLASYNPDPWKRHDAEVWARYACSNLHFEVSEHGGRARIGYLKDEWRNSQGKADFDGWLATCVASEGGFEKGTKKAREGFLEIIKEAKSPTRFLDLFPTEKERIIQAKLARLNYTRKIPVGGKQEQSDAKRIRNCHEKFRIRLRIEDLYNDLRETHEVYYYSKPPAEKRLGTLSKIYSEIKEMIENCDSEEELVQLKAARRACWIQQQGWPEVISDFTLMSEFKVITQDKRIERLFVAKNNVGERSRPEQPKNASLASSVKFREWLLDCGNFHWRGGDNQLQLLMTDLDHHSAWKEIREIDLLGYHPESKLYLFGDCAVTPDGEFLFTDHNDIVWYQGVGYRIDPDNISEFAHGAPKLFQSANFSSAQEEHASIDWDKETEVVSTIFSTMMKDFHDNLGDHSGTLALGATMSYIFSAHMIKKYNAIPGLWIHGRMSGGKTTIAKLLMHIWGFPIGFKTQTMGEGTTNTGMDRVLSQYCGLPVWFDEFRINEATANKIASLRNAYNQQAKSKARIDQTKRIRSAQPLTMPMVTGEGTVQDAATKSRFVSVVLSAANRLPLNDRPSHDSRYNRMENEKNDYHRVGRWMIKNRKELTAAFDMFMTSFLANKRTLAQISQDRLRLTYGTAYSTIKVLCAKLQAKGEGDFFKGMESFLYRYATEATHDVSQEAFLNRFLADIVSGVKRQVIDKNFVRVEYATISKEASGNVKIEPTGSSNPHSEVVMRIASREVFSEYARDKRQQGEDPDLDRGNIQSEMKKEPFWINPPNTGARVHRMSIDGRQLSVWALRVSKIEDEELKEEIETLISGDGSGSSLSGI